MADDGHLKWKGGGVVGSPPFARRKGITCQCVVLVKRGGTFNMGTARVGPGEDMTPGTT